jgi:hypothetical protein
VKCPKCGRILGKIEDGIFHSRVRKEGAQIFVDLKGGASVMCVCPSVVWGHDGRVVCGERNFINSETLNQARPALAV